MIDIIGVQLDLGASKKGVNMGPAAVRFAGLTDMLDAEGISWEDEGDLLARTGGRSLPNMRYYEDIIELNGRVYRECRDALKRGMVPLVIGGDHSLAAGSVAATSTFYKNIGVIWVDAHADFNDDKSTVSGNVHGMPLSAVCGCGPDCLVGYDREIYTVDPQKVVIIGGRDIEPQEWEKLERYGVKVFTAKDVKELGVQHCISEAIRIAGSGTEGIHVSYDIDSMDPRIAPGVGTPVPDGLALSDGFTIASAVAASGKLLALDMVEVNPILDDRDKTARIACDLITVMLKGR
ncbi:MAG: arginase [Firmicutes bacterium]|nr:arginase [Bacillota bacterium]